METTIQTWLGNLGLAQYAAVLSANAIDFDTLPDLTELDLEKLGLPLGHRKKLLKAIARLNGSAAMTIAQTPGRAIAPQLSATSAERRQLTVMFCDLVGSTALTQQLDLEALREVMGAFQQSCGAIIEQYEGHVAQYLGDGLMVYFGWPQAHEDDAERAVLASLQIIDKVKSVAAPDSLRVRIGIATGPVVVGETGAGDASVPKLAVGETPNLAARLQSRAGPDEIVISLATQRLLGAAFDYQDLGAQSLKGIVEPVPAWRVLGSSRAEGRFEAAHGQSRLTPLVGREEEIALLLHRWRQARDKDGQAVMLCGEPGIGKSRVAQALRERIAGDMHVRLRYQCSPFHAQSSMHPIIEQIERAAAFAREDPPEQKLDKIEALIKKAGQEVADVAPLFAALLTLPASRYAPLQFSAQRQKERTLEAFVEHIEGLSASQPVLALFEDVHWMDPTSLEALDLLLTRIRKNAVLVVITYRPEFQPTWIGRGEGTLLTLNRLGRRQAAHMVKEVTGGKPVPEQVLDQIVAKTDGIPLFVEELTKSLMEAGYLWGLGEQGRQGTLTLSIPSTLQDSLMARLDRLGLAKEVAQIGACIGREFSYELLAAVCSYSQEDLQASLKKLVDSELAYARDPDSAPTRYTFKHALVEDVAYSSLLKSRRQAIHRLIAEALQKQFPQRVANEPEVLAHHFAAAELNEQAVTYWLAAASRAIDRFANTEGTHHAERGLEILRSLPECEARDKQELLLQMALGSAIGATKGYTPLEVGRIFARARELCQKVGEMPQMLSILFALWIFYIMRAEYDASAEMADQVLEMSRKDNDRRGKMIGQYTRSGTKLFLGYPNLALASAEAGFALHDPESDRTIARNFAFDFGPGCPDWASCAAWLLGFPDKSRSLGDRALAMVRGSGHPLTVATIVVHAAFYEAIKGDPKAGLFFAREAIEICRQSGIFIRLVEAELLEGWAEAELGDTEGGIAKIDASIRTWQALGARIGNPVWFSCLARAFWRADRLQEARQAFDSAFESVEKNNERIFEAELYRLYGQLGLAMQTSSAESAESSFRKAMAVASSQNARMLELRAATSLASLWQTQGKQKQAYQLLAPIYQWFREGFDTRDLKETKALLDELG